MKKVFLNIVICILFLTLSCFSVCFADNYIRILHINDFHGFGEEQRSSFGDNMVGGAPYMAGIVNRLRSERQSLLLSAGDMIQGSNWANLFKGKSVIELMNKMRFDAMVAGNHEFDFGQAVLRERIREAKFPILGANIVGLEDIKPYIIKELNGVRIGIIGVITEETQILTHPDNIKGITFLSPVDVVKKAVEEIRNKVDLLIVLSHLGYHNDMLLAQRINGIDAIIGGHSHTKIEKPVFINKTLIAQSWEHGKAIGVVDFTISEGKPVKVDSRIVEVIPSKNIRDQEVLKIVRHYQKQTATLLRERIGETKVELDGENVRTQETNFGNLVSDIIRERAGSEIAILNGGSIRMSLKRGTIRLGHIYNGVPFDNYVVAMKLTGKKIREALQHGIHTSDSNSGRFPQVSGIKFTYTRPQKGRPVIKDVLFEGRPLELDREYVVATTDFLFAGGDGYNEFGGYINDNKLTYMEPGKWLRDVVADYIKDKKIIEPAVEGRIKEIK